MRYHRIKINADGKVKVMWLRNLRYVGDKFFNAQQVKQDGGQWYGRKGGDTRRFHLIDRDVVLSIEKAEMDTTFCELRVAG